MKNKRGLTWIEMLVIIAIISILTALAIPLLPGARKAAHKANTPGTAAKVETDFPTERILTIFAAEYCESVGRKISDYRMVGVCSWSYNYFQKAIPVGTEAVVGFTHSSERYAGTALIPKDR